jgi:hypothetical protein
MALAQATQTRVDHPSATLRGGKRAALRSAPMRAMRLMPGTAIGLYAARRASRIAGTP